MTDNSANAQTIRDLYKESGLSYEELSVLTGIKKNTLAQWITLRKSPPDYCVEFVRERVRKYRDMCEVTEIIAAQKQQ